MVLLVNDFAPSLHLHARMLRRRGWEVREADSAETARRLVRETPPKLVLLDINLPDANGFALCRELRADYPELTVVITSATYTDEASRLSAMYAGAADFIAEPFSDDMLAAVVKRYA
jgi:two-component system sensor histidine kinase/response regulator